MKAELKKTWEASYIERPTPLPREHRETRAKLAQLFDEKVFLERLEQVHAGMLTIEKSWISFEKLRAPKGEDFPRISKNDFEARRELGWEAVKKGLVGMLILAGGTSSRMKENKLFMEVIPGKSLLFLKYMTSRGIAEKRGLPNILVIMTSPFTTMSVVADLAKYDIKEGRDYLLFEQSIAPRVTEEGEIITYRGDVQYDVTGHGDVFTSIKKTGTLQKLSQWGVTVLIQSNTDNPLIVMDADEKNPFLAYIGDHLAQKSAITAQVATKEPTQRGGVPLWYKTDSEERLVIVEESQMDPNFYKEIHYTLPYFNPLTFIYDISTLRRLDTTQLPVVLVRRREGKSENPFYFYRFETTSASATLIEPTRFLPDTISGVAEEGMFTQLKNPDQLPAFQELVQKRLGDLTA